jgi:hypothetical protein
MQKSCVFEVQIAEISVILKLDPGIQSHSVALDALS